MGRRTIEIGNPDKVLFPGEGITKGDLVDYYHDVAPAMLPHVRDRPMNLLRHPDGIAEKGFYQQQAADYFPDWIRRVAVEKREGGRIEHVVCDDAATLVYLANQACITPHVWLSRTGSIERPDQLIFDLDPSDGDFRKVVRAARAVREVLEELELVPFLKTTGSRGLHVVVPLRADEDFDAARQLARDAARAVEQREPDGTTLAQRKSKRGSRVYLDVMRNAFGQTAVAPYAVRARRGAPVATPIDWSELDDARLRPDRWTLGNLRRRLGAKDDPWKGMGRRARGLGKARERLRRLLGDD